MTVLVTGSTGAVGSEAVRHLAAAGTQVRALTRSPNKAHFPTGVTAVQGDFTDPSVMREALTGVSGLFLLSPVALEELTGTLHTLTLAREAGVRDVVYLSVIHADRFIDPPHFAAKAAAERMIDDLESPQRCCARATTCRTTRRSRTACSPAPTGRRWATGLR